MNRKVDDLKWKNQSPTKGISTCDSWFLDQIENDFFSVVVSVSFRSRLWGLCKNVCSAVVVVSRIDVSLYIARAVIMENWIFSQSSQHLFIDWNWKWYLDFPRSTGTFVLFKAREILKIVMLQLVTYKHFRMDLTFLVLLMTVRVSNVFLLGPQLQRKRLEDKIPHFLPENCLYCLNCRHHLTIFPAIISSSSRSSFDETFQLLLVTFSRGHVNTFPQFHWALLDFHGTNYLSITSRGCGITFLNWSNAFMTKKFRPMQANTLNAFLIVQLLFSFLRLRYFLLLSARNMNENVERENI